MQVSRRVFLIACCIAVATLFVQAEEQAFTFVQMCDTQLGMGGYEHDVETFKLAVAQINKLTPDFVIICGDLVNDETSDQAFADFLAIKAGFECPCHCVAGNHDVGNAPSAASLERYRRLVGKDYYSFEHKGCLFVVVDTQLWKSPLEGETEEQDEWLRKTLAAASEKQQRVLVAGHQPLFLKSASEDEEYFNLPKETRAELLELFAANGVVAVLTGHTHRNIVNDYHGMQMVTSATTSRNFDNAPMGYRVWRVGKERPYKHEFIAVEGAKPPEDAK